MKKTIIGGSFLLVQSLCALSFGSMGNTSAGLGDSGVALRKSAWGVYYNPALLAADNRGKFGYSAGAMVSQRGIAQLASAFLENAQTLDIEQIWNLYQASPRHSMDVISQNGFVVQISGGTHQVSKFDSDGNVTDEMIEERNPYGAFGIGAFLSIYASSDIEVSEQGDQNLEIVAFNANADAFGIALFEVPIGWGWRFESGAGDISIGAALKYMGVSAGTFEARGRLSDGGETQFDYRLPQSFDIAHNIGVDLGILYSIGGVNFGLVAKNINAPTFEVAQRRLKILPQFRAGFSYEFVDYFALTFDSDLLANELLFDRAKKTQMIGGGLLMDFKYIDLRFGVMGNIADRFEQGAIVTGGLNLLGFLDIALQASTQTSKIKGYNVPNLVTLKLGGSFTF